MEFLNYDPAELESKNSMPKPAANQPVHFNFRKSNILDNFKPIQWFQLDWVVPIGINAKIF